jgi:hypothetical protein
MDSGTAFPLIQKYHILKIEHNVFSIPDCLSLASEVEYALNIGKKFIVLEFGPFSILSGSLPGFLIEKIKRIKRLNGEMVIVAPAEEQREIFATSQLNCIVPVVESASAVHA